MSRFEAPQGVEPQFAVSPNFMALARRSTITRMIFLRIGRRTSLPCCALTLLAITFPAYANAQESPEAVARVSMQIILPLKLVAGAPTTLAVMDASGFLVPKATVEITGGQRIITDATGRASFNAPKNAGLMAAQIAPQGITAYAFVLAASSSAISTAQAREQSGVQISSHPRFISKGDKFAIEGAGFRGDADTNRVFLGDQQCFVLASSPVSLVIFPGAQASVGPTSLSVTIAGKGSVSIPVSVVQLKVSDSQGSANVGAQQSLIVHVLGTREPLPVEMVNKSPDIVQFPQGAVQRLMTSGGADNLAQVPMKCLKEGDYLVTARLLTTLAGPPDLESARQELLSARLAATGKWGGRLDNLLKRFDKRSPNAARIREDLAKLQRDVPPGESAVLLDTAMQDMVRD